MSSSPGAIADPADAGPRSDTLAASMLLLLGVTLGQRAIGLGRNVLFCGLLEDDQLGRWSLSFNLLLLAAPLVVLGLPGSFGRYVERYRQREQLRAFLARTASVTLAATCVACGVLWLWPHGLAYLLYGDASMVQLARCWTLTLAAVVAFNFLVELFTALRLVRFASLLQFVSSLTFAVAGVALLMGSGGREAAVLIAYAIASLLAVILGAALLGNLWRSLPGSGPTLAHRSLWRKLLPFAGWIWLTNLISNLFEVADQFMLKHFSGLDATAADALVGQYYSSRIVPLLLLSLATMFASSLLPHLCRDWEAGRRDAVRRQTRWMVKLGLAGLTLAAAVILCMAPLLFDWALGGRYRLGMSVLPGTLLYCVWYGGACLAICYLLCAETARLATIALACGLAVNLALNYLLAPRFALTGVMAATIVANGIVLLLVCHLCTWQGMRWDRGTLAAALLPLSLLLGGTASLVILAVVGILGGRWILNDNEQATVRTTLVTWSSVASTYLPPTLRRTLGRA